MTITYIELSEAIEAKGLRLVTVPRLPSPWSEAAKGILQIKNIPFQGVRLDPRDPEMAQWTGESSAPVAMYDQEPPRSGWNEILLLAERLAPSPPLLPADPQERAWAMGLSHEICDEGGLGWSRRLQAVYTSLHGDDGERGYPPKIAHYLASKYGYRESDGPLYGARVIALLKMLASVLHAQQERGSEYFVGQNITAVDVYCATSMALFKPLPPEQCAMWEALRPAFERMDEATTAALDPILIAHRDLIYERHLELPLTL